MWYQYCCRRPLPFCVSSKEVGGLWSERWERLYRYYFKRGFRYESILVQLDIYHKIKMSLRTLKRSLKVLGLNKSHATASVAVIQQIIKREIEGKSMLRGYRSMWNKLRTPYNITAPRTVLWKFWEKLILSVLMKDDPEIWRDVVIAGMTQMKLGKSMDTTN